MNSRVIKILAIATMTIDHIGFWLYPNTELFRIIGRIAMPLFCLLAANGVKRTRNVWKYLLRLFVFAVVIQAFINLFMYGDLFALEWWNVFFDLSFGVAAAWFVNVALKAVTTQGDFSWREYANITAAIIGLVGIVLLAGLAPVDYGSAAVLLVVMFYLALQHSVTALRITAGFAIAIFCALLYLKLGWQVQWWAFLALPFIILFSDRKLKISIYEKYAFYVYYPLHIVVIYLIQTFVF